MKKRSLSLLLALCLCLGLTVGAWAAEPTLAVTPSDSSPAVGDTFTVDVSIRDNPGFSAVQFTLTFDSAVLDCTAVTTGPALGGALSAVNPDASTGAIVAAASATPLTGNGTLATFTFKVIGSGAVAFGVKDYVLADEKGTDIPFALTGAEDQSTPPAPSRPEEQPETSKPTDPSRPQEKPEEKPEENPQEQPEETTPVTEHKFTDTVDHWAERYINAAVDLGLFQGYADGSFQPGKNVTRGEYVTVLWRMAGQPVPQTQAPFADTAGIWCAEAVSWAYEKGYVNGKTVERFAPNDPVTRQEAMKILFLFHGGVSGQEALLTKIYDDAFTDSGTLASWAKAPMYWAVYNKLLSGTSETTLGPTGRATRAQLAKILVNYSQQFGI